MSDHDLRRVLELCEEALALPTEQRPAFLRGACGENADLRLAVEALLAEQSAADRFFGSPAWPGPENERAGFFDRAPRSDAALRGPLEPLLAQQLSARGSLETPAPAPEGSPADSEPGRAAPCVPDHASTLPDVPTTQAEDPAKPGTLPTSRPEGLLHAAITALVSRLWRKPADHLRHTRQLGYYLREAIRDRIAQGLPPPGVTDLRAAQRYSRARAQLALPERELVVGALELGYTEGQLALATNRPSAVAARIAAESAVRRLAEEMSRV